MKYARIFILLFLNCFAATSFGESDTQKTIEQSEVNALNKLESELPKMKPQATAEQNKGPQTYSAQIARSTNPVTPVISPTQHPNSWEKPNPWAEPAKTNPWANQPLPPAPNTNPTIGLQNQSAALPPPPNIFAPAQQPATVKPKAPEPQTNPSQQKSTASDSSTASTNR